MFCHKHFSDKLLLVVRTLSWLQYFSIVLSIQTGYNKNPIMWFFMGLRKENITKRKMIKGRYIAPWRLSSGAFSVADSCAFTSVSGQHGGSKGSRAGFLFWYRGWQELALIIKMSQSVHYWVYMYIRGHIEFHNAIL